MSQKKQTGKKEISKKVFLFNFLDKSPAILGDGGQARFRNEKALDGQFLFLL